MVAADLMERKFHEWTDGLDAMGARINVFEKVRDIPYAVVPSLISYKHFPDIINMGQGSCTPKHFLLCHMFQRLGVTVLYAVYPYRWEDLDIDYPRSLRSMTLSLPTGYHLACRVESSARMALVDATVDLPLKSLGLPVTEHWDGLSDTVLPIKPCGDEQLYHPSEAPLMEFEADEASLAFYAAMNGWLAAFRKTAPH